MSSTRKYKRKKSAVKQIKEPVVTYNQKKITVFNSFEEAEEDNYKWLASLSPEQHLINAVKLIKRIHPKESKKPIRKRELVIVK